MNPEPVVEPVKKTRKPRKKRVKLKLLTLEDLPEIFKESNKKYDGTYKRIAGRVGYVAPTWRMEVHDGKNCIIHEDDPRY